MADIYRWLEDVRPLYAPTSPPLGPTDENDFTDLPMDQFASLNIDDDGKAYFNHPETTAVDPSLLMTMDPPMPPTSGQAIVTVPEHLAEATSRLLIHLAQITDTPKVIKTLDEESIGRITFNTAEEEEALRPITEGSPEPPTPSVIDGVYVNESPKSKEIKDILDLRRNGSSRKTFYLARTIGGIYYWFPSRRTYRDPKLHRSIRRYRRKARVEAARRKTHGVKKLRNGRTVRF